MCYMLLIRQPSTTKPRATYPAKIFTQYLVLIIVLALISTSCEDACPYAHVDIDENK